jgi:hypothetical protein
MSLDDYSDEDLQQELNDRKQRKNNAPQPLENPDYSNVFASAVEYMTDVSESGREPKDYDHYMFETAMEAVYGKGVWDYINEVLS